ncbi:MAG: hypothetical protein H6742_03655 [Alphaproteobacteria bacterium]|nr:hypothetical protein [Alphaproteobacteria bacterium]
MRSSSSLPVLLFLSLAACGGGAPPAPAEPGPSAAAEGTTPAVGGPSNRVVLERGGPGKPPPPVLTDPLAWLDSEVRAPMPEVAALGTRVEAGTELDAALTELDAWIAAHPKDADALYWRGRAHQARKEAEPARADLQAAVDADPGFLAARQHLTDELVGAGDHAAALVQLDAMIAARPDVGLLYANRAYVKRSLGDGPGSAQDVIAACDKGHARSCNGAAREKARLEAQAEETAEQP